MNWPLNLVRFGREKNLSPSTSVHWSFFWQDLDLFNDYEWKSTDDANHYKQTVEAHRIYKFLVGLNVEFDEVRGQIIGRVPLPKISEVFAEVQREESRRYIMLGKKSNSGSVESSAFSVAEGFANKAASFQPGLGERPQVWCDYCNKPRQTRETCRKIHGKPTNWQSSKPEREEIVQIPRPMLLSMNQSQVPLARSRWITFWNF